MYSHILIATDGSDLAGKAVDAGLALAKALGARATAVTVTEPWDALVMADLAERGAANPIAGYEARAAELAAGILRSVTDAAGRLGVECGPVHVADRYPAGEITVSEAATAAPSPFAQPLAWRATNQLMYDQNERAPSGGAAPLSEQVLLDVLNNAGRLVGVGDFRPTYGRFAVVAWDRA